METVTVQGVEVPALGLGTWQLEGEQCYQTVSTALELGYRHVDTAQMYENEAEVGERYDKSAAQVALRWAIEHDNVAAIPKASSEEHLAANIDVFDFELTVDEHDRIIRPSFAKSSWHYLRNEMGL